MHSFPLDIIDITLLSVSLIEYPKNSVGLNFAFSSNQIFSVSLSPDPDQLDLAKSRCCSSLFSNSSVSTLIFFDLRISCVKSIGNPYVSYNLKAEAPESVSPSLSSDDSSFN